MNTKILFPLNSQVQSLQRRCLRGHPVGWGVVKKIYYPHVFQSNTVLGITRIPSDDFKLVDWLRVLLAWKQIGRCADLLLFITIYYNQKYLALKLGPDQRIYGSMIRVIDHFVGEVTFDNKISIENV